MVLALTFVLLVSALALVFWGTTRFLQSYLYSEPADRLPIRALVAGLVVGGFLTLWTLVNTRADAENKYGTFFDFNPVGAKEVTAFEAVRRFPNKGGAEETVAFKRKEGSKPPAFADEAGNKYELTNTSKGFLTIALLLDDGDGRKARFNAAMNEKNPNVYASSGDAGNRQFEEQGGSRHLDGNVPATVYSPSRGVVIAALGLNALQFVAFFAAFWPVLRYGTGHAMGLALACGAVTLLVLMPLLFKLNKPKPAGAIPPAVTAPQ